VTALFLSAMGLGIAFCLPPGAVTAEAIRRGLRGGYWAVLRLELGSLIGDATWAALALVGAAFLVQAPVARVTLGVCGGLLLLWLAFQAFQGARSGDVPKASPDSSRRDFTTGALLSLTNPLSIAFWLGVGGASVATQSSRPEPMDFVIFFGGFLLSCFLYCFAAAAVIAWGRALLRPRFFRVVYVLSGLGLLYFGGRLIVRTLFTT